MKIHIQQIPSWLFTWWLSWFNMVREFTRKHWRPIKNTGLLVQMITRMHKRPIKTQDCWFK